MDARRSSNFDRTINYATPHGTFTGHSCSQSWGWIHDEDLIPIQALNASGRIRCLTQVLALVWHLYRMLPYSFTSE